VLPMQWLQEQRSKSSIYNSSVSLNFIFENLIYSA
jgi:hypothetical protein